MITNSLRWIPFGVLFCLILCFTISANRGIDLTDESYYLLSYLEWNNLSATITFFGAYLDIPFRLLGKNIAAIRIFGMFLLCAGSAVFFHGLTKLYEWVAGDEIKDHSPTLIVAITAGFIYYGFFFTLRAPSYNLLGLFCILTASGLLFGAIADSAQMKKVSLKLVSYGLLVSILLFVKATAGAVMTLIHFIVIIVCSGQSARSLILTFLPKIVFGALINVLLLSYAYPHWLDSLVAGLDFSVTLDKRDQAVFASLINLGLDIQNDLLHNWFYYLGITGSTILIFSLPTLRRKNACGWWIFTIILASIVIFLTQRPVATWMMIISFLYLALWSVDYLNRERREFVSYDYFMLGLFCFLMFTPLAFSFGTNVPITRHSSMSLAIPVIGLLILLNRLLSTNVLSLLQYRFTLVPICLLTLAFQVMPWVHSKYTYRLRTSLYDQNQPMLMPNSLGKILVDQQTISELNEFTKILNLNGFKPSTEILDLTGDSPGLTYRAGGKPLGVAWLVGGYQGSREALRKVLRLVGSERVKCSWLLTSEDSPRRIPGWRGILETEVMSFDYDQVGDFTFTPTYSWGDIAPARQFSIVVWKPRDSGCGVV